MRRAESRSEDLRVLPMPQSARELQRAVDRLDTPSRRSNPSRRGEPTIAERLKGLAEYLRITLDPYDFADYLQEFFELDGDGPPESFREDDPQSFVLSPEWKGVERRFVAWLREDVLSRSDVVDDPYAPAYLHFDVRRTLPSDTWLVHFSDAASSIATEGFVHGHADERTLHLTTNFVSHVRLGEPGWNFAFEATSRYASAATRGKKYGSNAVLFRAAAVLAYHHGDEEEQAIFWGPSVKRFVLLVRGEGNYWSVSDLKTYDVVEEGRFEDVARWAIDHADGRKPKILSAPIRAARR